VDGEKRDVVGSQRGGRPWTAEGLGEEGVETWAAWVPALPPPLSLGLARRLPGVHLMQGQREWEGRRRMRMLMLMRSCSLFQEVAEHWEWGQQKKQVQVRRLGLRVGEGWQQVEEVAPVVLTTQDVGEGPVASADRDAYAGRDQGQEQGKRGEEAVLEEGAASLVRERIALEAGQEE